MIKIKIIYNQKYIDDKPSFDDKVESLQKKYSENFNVETSESSKFDLMINNKLVYTLDDNFSMDAVPTKIIVQKIDQHIYSAISTKNSKNASKFDDIDIIDY